MNSLQMVSKPDKMAYMFSFGVKLRDARKAKGFSQAALAEIMGYQRTNLVNIEAGRKKASDEVLKALASIEGLGLVYEELKAWQILDLFSPEVLARAFVELEKQNPELVRQAREIKEKRKKEK